MILHWFVFNVYILFFFWDRQMFLWIWLVVWLGCWASRAEAAGSSWSANLSPGISLFKHFHFSLSYFWCWLTYLSQAGISLFTFSSSLLSPFQAFSLSYLWQAVPDQPIYLRLEFSFSSLFITFVFFSSFTFEDSSRSDPLKFPTKN